MMKTGPKRIPPMVMFEKHANRADGCWLWSGKKTKYGYGQIRADGDTKRYQYAHRFSYELHKGPITPGLVILHSCDTPNCVNPEHLSQGTKKANSMDMSAKGRQGKQQRTHCAKGHPMTIENIIMVPRKVGYTRSCLACYTATCRARTLRNAEATRLRGIEYRRKRKIERDMNALQIRLDNK